MADRPHPLLLAAIAAQNSPYKVRGNIPLEIKPDGETNEVFLVRGSVPLELRPDGSNIIGPFPVRGEIPISLNPQGIAGSTPINVSGSVPIPSIAPRGRASVDSSSGGDPMPTNGLAFWYSNLANTTILQGDGDVDIVSDQSDNNNDLDNASTSGVGVLVAGPNSQTALRCNSSGMDLGNSITSNILYWFVVCKLPASGAFTLGGANVFTHRLAINTTSIEYRANGSANSYSANHGINTTSGFNLFEAHIDPAKGASNVQFFVNGSSIGSGTANGTPIMTRFPGTGAGVGIANAEWSEQILYTATLSGSEITTVRSRIATDHGITLP